MRGIDKCSCRWIGRRMRKKETVGLKHPPNFTHRIDEWVRDAIIHDSHTRKVFDKIKSTYEVNGVIG